MTTHAAAAADGSALRRCIACDPAAFAREHWGRAPLLTRAADLPQPFTDLFDAASVDELVSNRALRTPFLRMAKDGEVLPERRFTQGGGAGATVADQAADDKVLHTMADGATLVLQALHRSWPPLVDFGSRLSTELGHPVQINAYITPPQNQGFAPHYDVHDVFVLQVAGGKQWTIHEPVVTDPLEDQPWQQHASAVRERVRQPPLLDALLEPGDALYLPRGTIHAATAQGETSIHLTVGVHPITRYHLVQQLLDLVQNDQALRTSLPMAVDLADPAVLVQHLTETVQVLRDALPSIAPADVARRVEIDLMRRTRPEPIGPLAQLSAAHTLTADTPVRLRPGLRHWIEQDAVERNDAAVRIVLLDRTVSVPAAAADAVKWLLNGAAHEARTLPGLDVDAALDVVRRLLREGVLVPDSLSSLR